MIAFVKEAEALMEKGQLDRLRSDEGERHLSSRGLKQLSAVANCPYGRV